MPKRPPSHDIPMEVLEQTAAALRVLAHPHRLKTVELLMKRELAVGELADLLDIPHNTCSQHLNLMRAHGLLTSRRDGSSVYYSVDNPDAVNVIKCIRKHRSGR